MVQDCGCDTALKKSSLPKCTTASRFKASSNENNMSDRFQRETEFVWTVWPCLGRKIVIECTVSF